MTQTIRIAVDAMSGDYGPLATIPAVISAVRSTPSLEVVLVGQSEGIKAALGDFTSNAVSVVDASDVVRMDESPGKALRNGKESSIWKMLELVAEGRVDACVSAGNTGALMAIARYKLKMMPGIHRPAICAALPTREGDTYMLDLGADVSANAEQLLQFAKMGGALFQTLYQEPMPSIGLLNIGSEKNKGHGVLGEAAELLRRAGLNYYGYVEGNDLHAGKVNVIVTDGFSGNIALKSSEGMAEFFLSQVQQAFGRNVLSRLAGMILGPVVRQHIQRLDPRQHNGATLLGLNGLVVKSHGNADSFAFEQALKLAYKEVNRGLVKQMQAVFADSPE